MDNNTPTPPPHQQMRQNQSSQRGSREKEQTPQPSSSSPGSEPASQISSMTSRIQDSASGLLQNTFSAPSSRSAAHDIASTLATGLDSSGKGSSSSHVPLQSGSSTPGTIPQSHGLSLGQPSSRASEARRFPSESFRSAPPSAASNLYDEDDYRTWERFQDPPQNNIINDSNGGDALLLHPYDVSSGKGKGKFRTEEPVDLLDPSAIPPPPHPRLSKNTYPTTPSTLPGTTPPPPPPVITIIVKTNATTLPAIYPTTPPTHLTPQTAKQSSPSSPPQPSNQQPSHLPNPQKANSSS
ncbi:hypothetical protein BDBG_16977 [Blastomyces gilchristii SLH14081]|uniref:Uncharacterized protein n=1 Tax=Blastomyces gilchristii (strain SLH14081) TaxID=559298 RepID=A0A179UJE6_BLAGS|nr:uncharacterized protein BDBG_16977 [Blastomyces gilchristii SLH14081]OAT08196.1 hypothetical protein BDBG_16977 [Blastomyces gilchristii SLH14081]